MNTTELRKSFKHIHGYEDWQRQCEQLADALDAKEAHIERLLRQVQTINPLAR